MNKDRIIVGDWIGALYSVGGHRLEWKLSLNGDGTYLSTIVDSGDDTVADSGRWTHDEESNVIVFHPGNEDAEPSRWWVLDVTNCERANTLLVLRRVIVASRNLPRILYRVHLQPDERTTWHGRRVESPST